MRKIKSLNALVSLVEELEEQGLLTYIRWSRSIKKDIEQGYSINHATGREEAGLSVNNLNKPEWAYRYLLRNWIAQQVAEYSYLFFQGGKGTKPYILTGEEIGRGSDNEPLLEDVEVVGELTLAAAEEAREIMRKEDQERDKRTYV